MTIGKWILVLGVISLFPVMYVTAEEYEEISLDDIEAIEEPVRRSPRRNSTKVSGDGYRSRYPANREPEDIYRERRRRAYRKPADSQPDEGDWFRERQTRRSKDARYRNEERSRNNDRYEKKDRYGLSRYDDEQRRVAQEQKFDYEWDVLGFVGFDKLALEDSAASFETETLYVVADVLKFYGKNWEIGGEVQFFNYDFGGSDSNAWLIGPLAWYNFGVLGVDQIVPFAGGGIFFGQSGSSSNKIDNFQIAAVGGVRAQITPSVFVYARLVLNYIKLSGDNIDVTGTRLAIQFGPNIIF